MVGEYFALDADKMEYKDLPLFLRASMSMPGFFPYTNIGEYSFIDGGTISNLDAFSAIERCMEGIAESHEEITIDVILLDGGKRKWSLNFVVKTEETEMRGKKTLDVIMRNYNLESSAKTFHFLLDAIRDYPMVDWRYIIYPTESFPGINDIVPLVREIKFIQWLGFWSWSLVGGYGYGRKGCYGCFV